MSLIDEPGAHLLSPEAKNEVTAFYVWQTIARRQRLQRGASWRRARCPQCGAHKRALATTETVPHRCRACSANAPHQHPKQGPHTQRWPRQPMDPEIVELELLRQGHVDTLTACFPRKDVHG